MRAGGSALFPRGQPLLRKMPVVVGRVVELPELLIAQLFIEAACLKAERVEPCRVTASLAGANFRSIHQLAPDASTAPRSPSDTQRYLTATRNRFHPPARRQSARRLGRKWR